MNSQWEQYLLYASLIIVEGSFIFILIETVKDKNTGFETKTLWGWMQLLIIPLFLAGGAFFLNSLEQNAEREIATDRQREQVENADLRYANMSNGHFYDTNMTDAILEFANLKALEIVKSLKSATIPDPDATKHD